jgi:hypothetical protein
MTTIGIIIIFIALLIFILALAIEKLRDFLKLILPLVGLFAILGFVISVHERIIEIPIPGFGPMRTATQQVVDDAKLVKETRDAILAQSNTINLVAEKASELQKQMTKKFADVETFIDQSKEDLQQKIDALNPVRQPISFVITNVSVTLRANHQKRFGPDARGAGITFVKGDKPLLIGFTINPSAHQSIQGVVHYFLDIPIDVTSPAFGQPASFLREAETINIRFNAIPENSEIIGGHVICVINGSILLNFRIPPQTAKEWLIKIPDIREPLQVLQP